MQLETAEDQALINEWYQADGQQRHWQEKERELRAKVVAAFGKKGDDATGTTNIELPAGWNLKIVQNLDYKLNDEKLDAALAQFDPVLAEALIGWKPSLATSVYKKLAPEQQALLNDCLTIKPSSPSVKLEAPKP
jgi:hypothetical protein